tara:strand:- start:257 stop:514 length:258 start_codon:yes stop_codon:yes gene_type:complete
MNKATHTSRLLDYLRKHRTITSLEAIRDLGNTRLSASIFNLKEEGHIFETKTVEVPNRFGSTTKVAEYKLIDNINKMQYNIFDAI